tara:strand:+ start:1468 stop:2079 length:612 start_codon:yes stop_codon:yes gene_type:complete
MEYIIGIVVGIVCGAFYMYRKFKIDKELLTVDRDMLEEKVHELLGHYNMQRKKLNDNEVEPPTRLDDTFKAQLQMKDDTIDRLNGLLESKNVQVEHDSKHLTIAASQILVLEDRLAKNKKVAVKREKTLKKALTDLDSKLNLIDQLESKPQEDKGYFTEMEELQRDVKQRDVKIERLEKRIQELEVVEDPNETGGYKRRKFID